MKKPKRKKSQEKPYTDKELYVQYLKAMLLGKPMYELAREMDCHIRYIHKVRNRVEKTHHYPRAQNARAQLWEHKYSGIWNDHDRNKFLETAVIKEMYFKSGFDAKEIATLCKRTPEYVETTLFS